MDREDWDDEEFDLEAIQARQDALEDELARQEVQEEEAARPETLEAEQPDREGLNGPEDEPTQLETPEKESARQEAPEAEQPDRESLNAPEDEPTRPEEEPDLETDWEAIVEAVLFTMGGPVELAQLAAAIGQDTDMAGKVVENLAWRYDHENRGMQVIRLEDSYQLCTRGRFYENLIRVATAPKRHVLTDVALETLSIIAYKQPVTRAEIEKIRGVNSDHAVNRLVEYGLVEEIGRLDAPGRPALFATTEDFLRRFGIGSKESLPDLDPVRAEEIRSEVEEELQVDLQELEQEENKTSV